MNNLTLISLIHEISQLGYNVQFCNDFEGMIRVELTEEYNDKFYIHYHLGFPGGPIDRLEKEVVETLSNFLKDHKGEQDETK